MTVSNPRQKGVPGLLGFSVHTDCVYLDALHAQASARWQTRINALEVQLFALNFAGIIAHIQAGEWSQAEDMVVDGIDRLSRSGATFAVVTSNTGSALAEAAADRIALPLLSITDVTCQMAKDRALSRIGLLSVSRTRQSGIFDRAGERAGIEIVGPRDEIAQAIDRLIFDELISGVVSAQGISLLGRAIDAFRDEGCDGVILGCTDLTHIIPKLPEQTSLPILDTTLLHARAAADAAIDGYAG